MALGLTIVFALMVAWLLVRPHFFTDHSEVILQRETALDALLDHKERCLQVLKDLELDFNTDKLAQTDYIQMKRALTVELSKIIKQIDSHATSYDQSE